MVAAAAALSVGPVRGVAAPGRHVPPPPPAPGVTIEILTTGAGRAGPVLAEGDSVVFVGGACVLRWDSTRRALGTVACAPRAPAPLAKALLAADAQAVYVAFEAGASVYEKSCALHRVARADGRVTLLATPKPCPNAIVADGVFLYGVGFAPRLGGSVWRLQGAGGELETLASFGRSNPHSLARASGSLIWLIDAFDQQPPIASIALDGGDIRRFGSDSPAEMAFEGDAVYTATFQGNIARVAPSDGKEDRLPALDGYPRLLALDARFLYAAVAPPEERAWLTIVRVPRAGGKLETLAHLADATAWALAGDALYITSVESTDCRSLRKFAKKVHGPVLGACDPSGWALRRLTLPPLP